MKLLDWAQYQVGFTAGVISGRSAAANSCAEQLEEMRLMLREAERDQAEAELHASHLEEGLEIAQTSLDAGLAGQQETWRLERRKLEDELESERTEASQQHTQRLRDQAANSVPMIGSRCQGCEHSFIGDPTSATPHTWKQCAAEWRRRYGVMEQKRMDLLDQVMAATTSDSAKMALEAIIDQLRDPS